MVAWLFWARRLRFSAVVRYRLSHGWRGKGLGRISAEEMVDEMVSFPVRSGSFSEIKGQQPEAYHLPGVKRSRQGQDCRGSTRRPFRTQRSGSFGCAHHFVGAALLCVGFSSSLPDSAPTGKKEGPRRRQAGRAWWLQPRVCVEKKDRK